MARKSLRVSEQVTDTWGKEGGEVIPHPPGAVPDTKPYKGSAIGWHSPGEAALPADAA